MRSEVVKVRRYSENEVEPVASGFYFTDVISPMLPEIKVNQEATIRISAEIVEDKKEEEKVGSKAVWMIIKDKGDDGDLVSLRCEGEPWDDEWCYTALREMCKDLPYGNHTVESIDFINGKIKFCETPRERLRRKVNELGCGLSWRDEHEKLREAVQDYLAATEEEK